MEVTSRNVQLALGSLAAIVVGTVVALYVMGSGLATAQLPDPDTAGAMNALILGLAFFAGMLLWWRHTYGYVLALIVGILFIVNMGMALRDIAGGNIPAGWLILIMPGIIFALILLGATVAAWRE